MLLHPRSSRKATGGFEKKKKKLCVRQKLEWLLPISSTGSRPGFEVVTGGQQVRRARLAACAAARTTAPVRVHDLGNARATWARQGEVATSFWRRDLAEDRNEEVLGRDMKIHVTTWGEQFEVTTSI